MTKLAFSSLLFFTLYSILQDTSAVFGAPVTGEQFSMWRTESIHGAQDGLHHQADNRMDQFRSVDNRMERGRSIAMRFDDMTAGNPLRADKGHNSTGPCSGPAKELIEKAVPKMMEYLGVEEDEAKEMLEMYFDELLAQWQVAIDIGNIKAPLFKAASPSQSPLKEIDFLSRINQGAGSPGRTSTFGPSEQYFQSKSDEGNSTQDLLGSWAEISDNVDRGKQREEIEDPNWIGLHVCTTGENEPQSEEDYTDHPSVERQIHDEGPSKNKYRHEKTTYVKSLGKDVKKYVKLYRQYSGLTSAGGEGKAARYRIYTKLTEDIALMLDSKDRDKIAQALYILARTRPDDVFTPFEKTLLSMKVEDYFGWGRGSGRKVIGIGLKSFPEHRLHEVTSNDPMIYGPAFHELKRIAYAEKNAKRRKTPKEEVLPHQMQPEWNVMLP